MFRMQMTFSRICRQVHTLSSGSPSRALRSKIAELEKIRKKRTPKKSQLHVDVSGSTAWLDTASLPVVLMTVGSVVAAKLMMMYDESTSQERLEARIKNGSPGTGTVRMLTREEWDAVREVRPRTPFESKLARPNARIRTGEPLHMEDVKDWSLDVLTDAFTRAEETVRHGSK